MTRAAGAEVTVLVVERTASLTDLLGARRDLDVRQVASLAAAENMANGDGPTAVVTDVNSQDEWPTTVADAAIRAFAHRWPLILVAKAPYDVEAFTANAPPGIVMVLRERLNSVNLADLVRGEIARRQLGVGDIIVAAP